MKINRIMIMIAMVIGTLASCDDEPQTPSKEEIFLKDLDGAWTLSAGRVMTGGKDVTNAFKGMAITFTTGKTYTVTNPLSPIWPASGTFTLEAGSNDLYDIRRDDNVLITVAELTASTVTLQLQYTAPAGKAGSVSGQYTFVMTR